MRHLPGDSGRLTGGFPRDAGTVGDAGLRSEEHTSELQSRGHLVCRLLLAKKKRITTLDLAYSLFLSLSLISQLLFFSVRI